MMFPKYNTSYKIINTYKIINRIYHHSVGGDLRIPSKCHDLQSMTRLPSHGWCKSWTQAKDILVLPERWWSSIFLLLSYINTRISLFQGCMCCLQNIACDYEESLTTKTCVTTGQIDNWKDIQTDRRWINIIYHLIEGGTMESHPSVQDLQSTTRLKMCIIHVCLKCTQDATFLDCLALT